MGDIHSAGYRTAGQMRGESGLLGVNGVTLLAAFVVVLMVVMGGFTLSNSQGGFDRARTPESTDPYAVVVNESTLVLRKEAGDPAVYDQLAVYVSADNRSQRLEVDEKHATGDDGDMLFERGEAIVRPLNGTLEGDAATVTLTDAAGSEIRFETTVEVIAGPAT